MSDELRPKVGLGVIVMKDGKVLVGRRNKLASHGEQLWCFPGGHLEYGESFEACAKRETREEAGIEIENVRFTGVLNSLEFLPKHFVTIEVVADWKSGEPRPEANDKMVDWGWYEPDALPEPMYGPSRKLFDAYRRGINFIDC